MSVFTKTDLAMVDADVSLYTTTDPDMFPTNIFDYFYKHTPWEQRHVTVYGKTFPEPRMTCWYGDRGYSYSSSDRVPLPMTPMLLSLRDEMQDLTKTSFNGVLLNLYHDGRDSVGYHSDNEPELGPHPTIASLSLGAERRFIFKHKTKDIPDVKLDLVHGDVLVMCGETQTHWKHTIPKTQRVVGARINLTFRNILG